MAKIQLFKQTVGRGQDFATTQSLQYLSKEAPTGESEDVGNLDGTAIVRMAREIQEENQGAISMAKESLKLLGAEETIELTIKRLVA